MPKKTSLDQARAFLKNLASAMLPGSTFALWVESTSQKNKFNAVLLPKDYDPDKWMSIDEQLDLVVKPLFEEKLAINGLDSFLKKCNPYLMLRPGQAVTLDWLIDTFKCDADELHQVVLRSIRAKANAAMKMRGLFNYNTHVFERGTFCLALSSIKHTPTYSNKTPNFKSLEELYVWADLHANG